jgi:hypothetical protein
MQRGRQPQLLPVLRQVQFHSYPARRFHFYDPFAYELLTLISLACHKPLAKPPSRKNTRGFAIEIAPSLLIGYSRPGGFTIVWSFFARLSRPGIASLLSKESTFVMGKIPVRLASGETLIAANAEDAKYIADHFLDLTHKENKPSDRSKLEKLLEALESGQGKDNNAYRMAEARLRNLPPDS